MFVVCNNLGILYYKMGNPENAGEMFLEAFEMLKGKELNNIGKNCAAFCFHALGNTTLRDDITFLTDAYPKLNK